MRLSVTVFTVLLLSAFPLGAAERYFGEPVGCYPSTTLTDNGPQDITLVLGRGAVMARGGFGNALAARPPQPLKIRGNNEILFGLRQTPTPAGRTVAPMTWESANFAAFQARGERHLRHMEFATATATRLNLGAFDWKSAGAATKRSSFTGRLNLLKADDVPTICEFELFSIR